MLRIKKSLIHTIAECRNCRWRCEDYLKAQQKSREHAESMNHLVVLDLGYIAQYDGRKKP